MRPRTNTKDPEIFRERWESHANDFYLLRNTLPKDRWKELELTIDDLERLIDDAAEELEDDE